MAKAHALNSAEATFSQNAQAGSGRGHKWPKLAHCKSNNCPTSLRGISQRPHLANMGFGRNHIWTNPARRIRQKPCMAKAHVRGPAETIFGPHAHAGSDGNNIRAACWIRQKPRMAKVQAQDPAETTFSQHALPGSGRSHVWAKCTGKIRQKPHSAMIRTPDPAETTFSQHALPGSGRSHAWPKHMGGIRQ